MSFHVIGQSIERGLDLCTIVGLRFRKAELFEECRAKAVGGEEPVQVAAADAPVFGCRPLAALTNTKPAPRPIRPLGLADIMDLELPIESKPASSLQQM